ncbi:hypothetical protein CASFOL_000238 [Castilleja foliolosa]|uniref:Uncharacterized protein n=1 Tax=Castilleja foliolosa TaxID=1961234 RepID=A0ABD3ENN7_9LAMI
MRAGAQTRAAGPRRELRLLRSILGSSADGALRSGARRGGALSEVCRRRRGTAAWAVSRRSGAAVITRMLVAASVGGARGAASGSWRGRLSGDGRILRLLRAAFHGGSGKVFRVLLGTYPVMACDVEMIGPSAPVPIGIFIGQNGDVIGDDILQAEAVIIEAWFVLIEISDDLCHLDREKERMGLVGPARRERVVKALHFVHKVTFN